MKTKKKQSGLIKYMQRMAATLLVGVLLWSSAGCAVGNTSSNAGKITPGSAILPIASKAEKQTGTADANGAIQLTGIFTFLDAAAFKMHYVDITDGIEYEVTYGGATDIQDQYQTIIAASQLKTGDIYQVSCDRNGKAVAIHESSDAWENSGITHLGVNELTKVITIGSAEYQYGAPLTVISGGERIGVNEIMGQDTVTVRGVGSTIYSVRVDRGHGYLQVEGVDDFVGGFIDIGTYMVYPITKGMVITAPEGSYNIAVQSSNKTLSGSKTVSIVRGENVSVDFSEYRTAAVQSGLVEFSIMPTDSVLYLDGKQVSNTAAIRLDYGRHTIMINAHGYEPYSEIFTVQSGYEKKIIDMKKTTTATTKSSTTATTASSTARTTTGGTTSAATNSGAVKDLTEGYYIKINEPSGAAVYVDSKYVGMVPVSVEKSAGTKTITLTQSGYESKSYNITIPNSTGDMNYSFPDMIQSTTGTTKQATLAVTTAAVN